jgi:hypothetical protein
VPLSRKKKQHKKAFEALTRKRKIKNSLFRYDAEIAKQRNKKKNVHWKESEKRQRKEFKNSRFLSKHFFLRRKIVDRQESDIGGDGKEMAQWPVGMMWKKGRAMGFECSLKIKVTHAFSLAFSLFIDLWTIALKFYFVVPFSVDSSTFW